MVYPTALHADSRCFDWDAPHRRVGGALAPPPGEGGALGLRILVDHSAVEVFTDGGQALATRHAAFAWLPDWGKCSSVASAQVWQVHAQTTVEHCASPCSCALGSRSRGAGKAGFFSRSPGPMHCHAVRHMAGFPGPCDLLRGSALLRPATQLLRPSPHAPSCTRRVYRGKMPAGEDPGLFLVADGGDAWADVLAAYGMNSIWEAPEDRPAKAHEPAEA